ncbi:MAG: hypothetical protein AB8B99_24310 [Phormidesmis sp.]
MPPNSDPPNSDADNSAQLPNSSSGASEPSPVSPAQSSAAEPGSSSSSELESSSDAASDAASESAPLATESDLPPTESNVPQAEGKSGSFPWFWLGAFIGTLFSAAGLGLAAWAWIFVNEDLSPLISKTLTNSLERPIELGDVEQVTFGSLRVGPSTLGASEKDPTTLTAESVTVRFDLIETLLTSELGIDLVVENADGVLTQDEEKGWLNFEIPEQEEDDNQESRFEVNLEDIRVRKSKLTLVPLPYENGEPVPIPLNNLTGFASLDKVDVAGESANRVRFELKGTPAEGGEIVLKGEVQPIEAVASGENPAEKPIQQATNMTVLADKAPLADVLSFTLSTIDLATDQVDVAAGRVSGTLDMAFRPEEMVDYSGVLSVEDVDISTPLLPLTFENVEGQTRFEGNQWTVDRISAQYGEIEAVAEGLIDFDEGYALTAEANNVSVEAFTNTAGFELPVPTEGVFDVLARMEGAIDNPQFAGSVIANEPLKVDKLTFTSAATDFLLQGNQLSLANIAATPNTGGALRGSGQVSLTADTPFTFQVNARSVPAEAIAQLYGVEPGFKLGLVSADAQVVSNGGDVRTTVDWQAPNALYPGTGTIAIRGDRYDFTNNIFQIGGGTVTGGGTLADGRWQGDVNLQTVQLSTFSQDLKGDISGQFNVGGNTADTSIGAIAASGNVRFSNGLATFSPQFDSLSDPLTAQVGWNGKTIDIITANTDRITASGTLTPLFDRGFEGLERLDLNVVAQGYEINDIPFVIIPEPLSLAGITNFSGSITGDPLAPNISGNVEIANLVANRLPFNTPLSGQLDFGFDRGLNLNLTNGLAENGEAIALNLGPSTFLTDNAVPDVNFEIKWRDAIATGQTEGDILTATADNFPLSTLNFPPGGAGEIGQLRGTLNNTTVAINLNNQTLSGDITIDQLGLGYLGAGQLAGQIRYANDLATLTNGQLLLNENRYTLNGSLTLGGTTPIYAASLATDEGDIQNLLTALSIYRLEDIRRGLRPPDWLANPPSQTVLDSVLATREISPSSADQKATFDLVQQLRRLSEIQAIQAEQAIAAASAPLPPLQKLAGPFSGTLELAGTGNDFELTFDLLGENWAWGKDYGAEEVIATGTLTPNILTFEPVRFASVIPVPTGSAINNTATVPPSTSDPNSVSLEVEPALAAVTLSGQLVYGRETELTSNLQASAQNLNVESFREIFQIPLDIDGFANARATVGGTLANPQLRGNASLDTVTINDTPIESATAQFLYQNARLSLASQLTATTPEQPLTLSAQIPYAFNFMDIQPESKAISADISVQDEGLALLNIFTDQVAWESGTGQFNLNIGGTLNSPRIEGAAIISGAVISAPILPEPLTDVTGNAIFNDEQIIVQGLQGQFSNGQLTAAGIFPLLFPIVSGPQLSRLTAPIESEAFEPEPFDALDAPESDSIASERNESGGNESSGNESNETESNETESNFNPLFIQPLSPDLPLTVNLEDIALNFQDLYKGGVNGQIIVGGSALLGGPQVSGQVVLSEGQVILPDGNAASTEGNGEPIAADASPLPVASNPDGISTIFRDLRLTLDPSTRIVQGNLLNFTADGTLLLNGPPDDLEPEGIIAIRSGRVSLFDTIFRLRGRDNTAVFTPQAGLQNPLLNISLRASVPEIRRNDFGPIENTPFARAEIPELDRNAFSSPGSLRTVRIRANVNGPANAIFENLELSSSPPRNNEELIALLGGGVANAVRSTVGSISGQDGDGFSGLINLVGGSLLTRLQDLVVNTLNVSEFSIFPVTAASRTLSDEDNENETGLDIGATVGFDIAPDASISFTKILTDDTDPEIGLNYRLTDALTVRGATNFDDVNQFLLEYEFRF